MMVPVEGSGSWRDGSRSFGVSVCVAVGLAVGVGCFVDEGPQESSPTTVGLTTSTGGGTQGSTTQGSTSGSTTALTPTTSTTSETTPEAPVYACPEAPGLLLCYEFEDGWDNDLLFDTSSSGEHGVMVGVDRVAGHSGSAGLFSEESEAFLSYDKTIIDQLQSGFTVAAWIQPGVGMNVGSHGILARLGHLRLGIEGVESSDATYNVVCSGGGGQSLVTVVSDNSLKAGAWVHVACVYDGAELSVWVNGVASGSDSVEISVGNDERLWVGGVGSTAPEQALTGLLDEVQVWNIPLMDQHLCDAAGIAVCPN